jgi:hypothetical protein
MPARLLSLATCVSAPPEVDNESAIAARESTGFYMPCSILCVPVLQVQQDPSVAYGRAHLQGQQGSSIAGGPRALEVRQVVLVAACLRQSQQLPWKSSMMFAVSSAVPGAPLGTTPSDLLWAVWLAYQLQDCKIYVLCVRSQSSIPCLLTNTICTHLPHTAFRSPHPRCLSSRKLPEHSRSLDHSSICSTTPCSPQSR